MKSLMSLVFLFSLSLSQVAMAQLPTEMPKPSKEHEWLAKFVGEWKTQMKSVMGPDQPPMECNGTITSRTLGGFWVLNEMTGDMAGAPMTGVQTVGYDADKGKYVGTWVDSMTAYLWQYEGTVDTAGNVLTLKAKGPNFAVPGQLTEFEDIYEFKSADEMKITSRMLVKEGEWVTFMSGTATRTK